MKQIIVFALIVLVVINAKSLRFLDDPTEEVKKKLLDTQNSTISWTVSTKLLPHIKMLWTPSRQQRPLKLKKP